jgi:hypothetical protein
MTTPEARRFRERVSIVLSVITLIVLVVVVVLQILRNELDQATQANRATICAAARIIGLNPVRQYPAENVEHYKKRLIAAEIFLRLASHIDCATVLAVFGIRDTAPTSNPRGGDAQSPQSGSQLPRAARDLRARPLTLKLNLSPRIPARPRPARAARRGRAARQVRPARARRRRPRRINSAP